MKKQNLFLYGSILGISILILFICSFLMPEKPMYQIMDNKEGTSFKPQYEAVIVIDPGHGGYDSGASSKDGKIVEKEFDLKIGLRVKEELEKYGISVLMTRNDDQVSWDEDNSKDLQARLDIATNAKADLMVSIHCNNSDVLDTSGSEIYVNSSQKESNKIASFINDELGKLAPELPSRGIKNDSLHLTIYNSVPTVIVEMGYLSNSQDVEFLVNEETQNKMINAIVDGIVNYVKTNQ